MSDQGLVSVCGRCKRGRHDKCLDRGYWVDFEEGDVRVCACDCWAPTDADGQPVLFEGAE
jgi:hypothetical protein